MSQGFIIGGGKSSDLNFRVIGSPTEPTAPRENDIWIDTNTPISNWYFSPNDGLPRNIENIYTTEGSTPGYRFDSAGVLTKSTSHSTVGVTNYLSFPVGAETVTINLAASGYNYYAFYKYENNIYTMLSIVTGKTGLVTNNIPSGATHIRVAVNNSNVNSIYINVLYKDFSNIKDGTVWIQTGLDAPTHFNGLRKNGIFLYPMGCSQYINNDYVRKSAYTYQLGAFQGWRTYLFESGYGIIEDWKLLKGGYTSGSISSTEMSLSGGSSVYWYDSCAFTSKTAIDLTDYSILKFEVQSNTDSGKVWVGASTKQFTWGSDSTSNPNTIVKPTDTPYTEVKTTSRTIVTVDISSLSGVFYPYIALKGTTFTASCYNIWLEY